MNCGTAGSKARWQQTITLPKRWEERRDSTSNQTLWDGGGIWSQKTTPMTWRHSERLKKNMIHACNYRQHQETIRCQSSKNGKTRQEDGGKTSFDIKPIPNAWKMPGSYISTHSPRRKLGAEQWMCMARPNPLDVRGMVAGFCSGRGSHLGGS